MKKKDIGSASIPLRRAQDDIVFFGWRTGTVRTG
jgi:hypothetical protein